MKTKNVIANSLENLERYDREHIFSGYDPYDALNSKKLIKINNKLLKIFLTQIFVYSPINFRPLFNIEPDKNPETRELFKFISRLHKLALIKIDFCNQFITKLKSR